MAAADDPEGYGARPGQTSLGRLLEDARTLSPAGVERVAQGWDRHADGIHESEREALRALEQSGRSSDWDGLRNRILGLTERGEPLVAWRSEHGPVGHRAEDALLAAALGLSARDLLDDHHLEVLVHPMAEALPWLTGGAI